MKKILIGALSVFLFSSLSLMAQSTFKGPVASPTQTLKQNFALGDITLEYSRPSVKGRVIFGDVVPYGKVWRTGANATTKITFSDDVKIEGKDVKAGTYGLYTIPDKSSWKVMLYSDLTLSGRTAQYDSTKEVIRFTITPTTLPYKVETFTMQFNNITNTSTSLDLTWDNVQVSLKITCEIDERMMKSIETTLATDPRPYYQAATYYYDNNKDLKQALIWVNKAVEINPTAFYMYMLKSRIEYKLGDSKAALATAEKTIELSKQAGNDDFVKMAEKHIAEIKSKK